MAVFALNAGNRQSEFVHQGIPAFIGQGTRRVSPLENGFVFLKRILFLGLDGPVTGHGESVVSIYHVAGRTAGGAVISRPMGGLALKVTA